jgi:hypothetical protein
MSDDSPEIRMEFKESLEQAGRSNIKEGFSLVTLNKTDLSGAVYYSVVWKESTVPKARCLTAPLTAKQLVSLIEQIMQFSEIKQCLKTQKGDVELLKRILDSVTQ